MSELVVGELPDNWVVGKVQDLIIIRNGYAFKSKYFQDDEGAPVIRQTNLSTDVVNFKKPKYLPSEFLDEYPDFKVIKGDMLIGLSGSIGNLSRYMGDLPALQNQRTGLLVERIPGATKFVKYYLQLIKKDLLVAAKGVAVQNISSKTIENWHMPIAPLAQQKRIIAKIEELFSHIDAGIAALNKTKKLLKQYRQSVLTAALTGELTKQWREDNKDKLEPASQLLERILIERREKWEIQQLAQFEAKGKTPKDDNWKEKYKESEGVIFDGLPDLPEEWMWARLDSITFIGTGMSVSSSRKVSDPIDVAYLRVANVQRGYLVLDKIKTIPIEKSKLADLQLQEWDVLYNEGGDLDKLGRGWIWENQVQPCITQNHVFRASPYIKERYHSIFLSIWGNTFGQKYFIDTGKQTTNLASINKGVLSAFPTPLPPLAEQKKIIQLVEEKLNSIERLKLDVTSQLIKAENSKQSILASAFSGRLVERSDADGDANYLLQKIEKQKLLNDAKQKLTKRKPTVKKVKGMPKRKILDVLKESSEPVAVDKLFEDSGYSDDLSSENIERFYSELKSVVALNEVEVCQISEDEIKQEDRIFYKAL